MSKEERVVYQCDICHGESPVMPATTFMSDRLPDGWGRVWIFGGWAQESKMDTIKDVCPDCLKKLVTF